MKIPEMTVQEPPILARSIVQNLENAIILGEIPGGTHLTEGTVCEVTGCSRSPVREALRLLEKEGLVVRIPRRGFRVSNLTVKELDDLYICRISLEMTAAELAAENGTDAELEAIRHAHLECVDMLDKNDLQGHFKANVKMTQCIFAAAHNSSLNRLMESIHKQSLRYRYAAYEKSADIRVKSVENNAVFVDLIINRNARRAAEQARRCIEVSHAAIRECLLSEVGDDEMPPLGGAV